MVRLEPARPKIRRSIITAEPNSAAIARMWIDWPVGMTQKWVWNQTLRSVPESQSENSGSCVVRSHSVNA